MPSGVYKKSAAHRAKLSAALTGVSKPPRTPEHCAAIARSKVGVSLSKSHCKTISDAKKGVSIPMPSPTPEHRKNISEGIKNSEAAKAEQDRQRGGNDIVRHHFIYDHANPENHTVEITRAEHTSYHHWMKRNGLSVPHINVTEENKDIFNRGR